MDKYKERYKKDLERSKICGEILSPFFYGTAGVCIWNLKWYFGIPLGALLILFASFINDRNYKLRQEIKEIK